MTAPSINLAEVFETLDQPVGVASAQGRLYVLSGAARRLLGVEAGSTVWLDLSGRDTFSEMRRSGVESGRYFLADVPVRGAQVARVNAVLCPLAGGELRVTFEEEAAAPDGHLFAPVLDGLPMAAAVCDGQRRIQAFNARFAEVFEERGEALRGGDLVDLVEPGRQDALRLACAAANGGEGAGAPANPKSCAGFTLARLESRSEPHLRGFIALYEATSPEVAALEAKLKRAEELVTLGQLATGVAHELKNPMASILNYAGYLLDKYDATGFEERDRTRLKRIVDGVERMDRFVHDLLHLARPDEGVRALVDLPRCAQRAVHMVRMGLEDDKVAMKVVVPDASAQVWGKASQLQQVFINLLSNAVKAHRGEHGSVRVEFAAGDPGWLTCRVIDDASGMSEETMAKIFEPFFTTRAQSDGTGLGLTLVRAIIERHGGVVDVESALGRGTTFSLRLPRPTAQP